MKMLTAVDIAESTRLPGLLIGLAFNCIAIGTLAFLTVRRSRSRSTYVMSAAAVGVNVGFGLFALFGILRFRTGTLPVVDMTYLFAGIALASFNALATTSLTLLEAVIANVVVIGVLELLGGRWLSRQPVVHAVTYERIELVHPARRTELIADLESRTGLSIVGVAVDEINFLNDTARISIQARPAALNAVLVYSRAENYER